MGAVPLMTAVILQARVNSTRLPGKALMDLCGKPLIVRVMESLARIPADRYVIACDPSSVDSFTPLAESCGFTLISGDPDDVLGRYCTVIRSIGADTVIRATGDNPFVFADAAEAALSRFMEMEGKGISYFGFDGLPYGAGVEIINAHDLLDAAMRTESPFDREHVGPALYNHQDRYCCVREPAPRQWRYPEARITVDLAGDYERITIMARRLADQGIPLPAPSRAVLNAWNHATNHIVLVPAAGDGRGSGHLRRCSDIARTLRADHRVSLVRPGTVAAVPPDIADLFVDELPGSASLIVADLFRSTRSQIHSYRKIAPVVCLDDGGPGRAIADYCLDTIPSPARRHPPNCEDPSFLRLPRQRKHGTGAVIERVLVTAGGLDEAGQALPAARAAARVFPEVLCIDPGASSAKADKDAASLRIIPPVQELREMLASFDLVITHYGLTAFEALAAGCRVILFSPTPYHFRLARHAGFAALPPGKIRVHRLWKLVRRDIPHPPCITTETVQRDLAGFLASFTAAKRIHCPLCGSNDASTVHRRPLSTISRCRSCGMLYTSYQAGKTSTYDRDYFFDEYRSQYGRTYLDDFEHIRAHGAARMDTISRIQSRILPALADHEKRILDIGCAYGPFLTAAKDAGWDAVGTDICGEAVDWVNTHLDIPAIHAAFPVLPPDAFPDMRPFSAVTLWYVIEHFEDLEPVFARIRQLLIPGGILAFSTPSGTGISARASRNSFYRSSPEDHYTIMEPARIRRQLERYGFRVIRIRSTGHHPERFPGFARCRPGSVSWKILYACSRLFRLGDTFEVYAMKRGTLEDVQ